MFFEDQCDYSVVGRTCSVQNLQLLAVKIGLEPSFRILMAGRSIKGASFGFCVESAVERQAISRACRIWQQQNVYTYHLVAKGIPERPKYYKLWQRIESQSLCLHALGDMTKERKRLLKLTVDKVLDTMVQHSKLGDMFDNLIFQPNEAGLVEGFSILIP